MKPLAIVQRQGERAAKLLHVVTDLNGAPREALDNEGELIWAAQLDTWGQLARCHVKDQDRAYAARFGVSHRPAANDPAVEIDLRFANQWEDEESGLSYNLNRYYDPQTAQYASQDPLGPAGGARTHGYVHNPVTWSGPLGLAGCPGGDGSHGVQPPNLSPVGARRTGAFNEAKRQSRIPTSQQPSRILPNVDRRGVGQPGRIYEFEVSVSGGGTRIVRIRDDAGGHNFGAGDPQNRGTHFSDARGKHYEH